ncbi:MAG TPA: discoidin domain-containing protein [Candidatus Udaeobacter sp.]|jgi:hypothetical protein|nr:discoidin domain-containing protein [Candidatus Udaeobacter sp.]
MNEARARGGVATPGVACRVLARAGTVAFAAGCVAMALAVTAPGANASPRVIDGFESAAAWRAIPADGVEMRLSNDEGFHGRSLRVDFRFVKGGGYAVLHRDVDLDLPANYAFRLAVRGHTPPQNLELKLVDSSGANVWWCNRRNFTFPPAWQTVTTRKRQLPFAWGPAGGGEIRHVAAIELAITAGSGGEGTVWFDDLTFEELPAEGAAPPIRVRASSQRPEHGAADGVDGRRETHWASRSGDARPWLEFDLGTMREFGGIELDGCASRRPIDLAIELEGADGAWRRARSIRDARRDPLFVFMPESEARRIRLRWLSAPGAPGARLGEMTLMPVSFGDSPESLFTAIAKAGPRGRYPRPYVGEQRYWTVVGVEADREKVLFGEDGAIETGTCSFSVEPFLRVDGRLLSWADARLSQRLDRGSLPIPTTRWDVDSLGLEVTATAVGDTNDSRVSVTYRLRSARSRLRHVTLDLALRPFQVNPPTQFLRLNGGVAPIHSLAYTNRVVRGDPGRGIIAVTPPARFGATTFDQGDITDFLARGALPAAQSVFDSTGFASGALSYAFALRPGKTEEVRIEIPLHGIPAARAPGASGTGMESTAASRWSDRLGDVSVEIPDPDLRSTLTAQLAWILVDRAGPSLRPGARAYARTWIRDGALMSAALLELGRPDVVRDFIEWFAGFTYDNGKVPCCVDERGSDPVPEHDSDGEFIFLVAEYERMTGDTACVRRVWPQVLGAARHLDALRAERRGAEWRTPANALFHGILPPSISHEGYSAHPEHSYWDDLFALRGYRDAADLAARLGDSSAERQLRASAREFAGDLGASVRAAMAAHHIDFVPGSADLGDFDATSTTIALDPVEAEGVLPAGALERTFEKYWSFCRDRSSGRATWDAYTPYELRAVGAFVRLGWRERADSLLSFLLEGRRPSGWRQWPEVVWRDARAPRFLGDLPHTWVGSDGIRSILTMLAYEREADQTLVLAAGVPERWARDPAGVGVRALRTRWGPLTYHLGPTDRGYALSLGAGLRMPPGGIRVVAPAVTDRWSATVNGRSQRVSPGGEIVVRVLPADVDLRRP